MLDYASLSALATVICEGSFERAARILHVTPSAISQRIRALEERVGCTLVIRDQPCRATEAGQRLCLHVNHVQLLEQELGGAFPALTSDGALRIGFPVAVNADSLATWFAPTIAAFSTWNSALLEVTVDDEGHTMEWLRSGKVMAAVTASDKQCSGCNSLCLGAMRYVAAASQSFVARYFSDGITAESLKHAPSLRFNSKDSLQERWAARFFAGHVQFASHKLPSPHAFVSAAIAGMGWGMHPHALVETHLNDGSLVELIPGTPLDIHLYWQYARSAAELLESLTASVLSAASTALLQQTVVR